MRLAVLAGVWVDGQGGVVPFAMKRGASSR